MPINKLDLKQIRGMLKLSQEEMAEKLNLSREHYVRLENDSSLFRKSKLDVAITISNISGIELSRFDFFY